MPFNFPNNPTLEQVVVNPSSSVNYTWNGTTWEGNG